MQRQTPLLSKANAIINLMGTVGGIITLVLIAALVSKGDNPNYLTLFSAVGFIMIIGAATVFFKVNEKKFTEEKIKIEKQYNVEEDHEETNHDKLSPEKRKSLIFMLITIFLVFFGYNAVISTYSKYALVYWGLEGGLYAYALSVANITALIAFIPIGILATKIGCKKTIFIGIIELVIAFGVVAFFKSFSITVILLFGLAGIGWGTICVNIYPIVVSLSKDSDIGKYTGYYYTASMSSTNYYTNIIWSIITICWILDIVTVWSYFCWISCNSTYICKTW